MPEIPAPTTITSTCSTFGHAVPTILTSGSSTGTGSLGERAGFRAHGASELRWCGHRRERRREGGRGHDVLPGRQCRSRSAARQPGRPAAASGRARRRTGTCRATTTSPRTVPSRMSARGPSPSGSSPIASPSGTVSRSLLTDRAGRARPIVNECLDDRLHSWPCGAHRRFARGWFDLPDRTRCASPRSRSWPHAWCPWIVVRSGGIGCESCRGDPDDGGTGDSAGRTGSASLVSGDLDHTTASREVLSAGRFRICPGQLTTGLLRRGSDSSRSRRTARSSRRIRRLRARRCTTTRARRLDVFFWAGRSLLAGYVPSRFCSEIVNERTPSTSIVIVSPWSAVMQASSTPSLLKLKSLREFG